MSGDGKRAPRAWSDAPILVIALGGNAISRPGDEPSVAAQFRRTRATMGYLLPVIASGAYRLVITHGNGPQVGNILQRSDLAAEAGVLPRIPIDAAVADTQGAMGYMIQQCLSNALWESGIRVPVVTVVTQVLVDDDDPAFKSPTKPIGRFYEEKHVPELERHGWVMKKDRKGYRRVVPSPEPREIVEEEIVRELLAEGVIVISCGGGGVPVVAGEGGSLRGVEAVIDKDLASSLLATGVGADVFMILTEVDRVALNFGTPEESPLDRADAGEMVEFARRGHFPEGSMGPKIDAVVMFLKKGGERAIITSPERLVEALDGKAGTHVVPEARAEAAGGGA